MSLLISLSSAPCNISALAPRLHSDNLITEKTYDNVYNSTKMGHDKAHAFVATCSQSTISIEPQSLNI